MSKILTVNRNSFQNKNNSISGKTKISFMSFSFILLTVLVISGAFYLYQVNDLVHKNYEVKAWKNKIQELQKNGQKNKIKEVELQSMYNIEKATQDFGLVPTNKVTYIEIDGTVAMK